ncbi:unnamed protein product, partial [Ectocarpus sp. 12 AP-2014]
KTGERSAGRKPPPLQRECRRCSWRRLYGATASTIAHAHPLLRSSRCAHRWSYLAGVSSSTYCGGVRVYPRCLQSGMSGTPGIASSRSNFRSRRAFFFYGRGEGV